MIKSELKIGAFGSRYWKLDDKIHNTDGPAVERLNGDKEWWLNDLCYCSTGRSNFYFVKDLIRWLNDRKKYE